MTVLAIITLAALTLAMPTSAALWGHAMAHRPAETGRA